MLSVDIRVVPDEDDLLAVNLYDKPGWKTVPELPSDVIRPPSKLSLSTLRDTECYSK